MEGCSTTAGEDGVVAKKKRENQSSWPRPEVGIRHHRRSKSASERNMDVARDGVLHSVNKNPNDTQMPPLPTRPYRLQSPLCDYSTRINGGDITSSNQRASLEKDIEQLQSRLQQEKSMRMVLERAMGRASSTLSPGHRHYASQCQTKELITEIELLEEEITNREQHVLSLYRTVFDNCLSRPPSEQNSSMASPAHTKHVSRKHPSIITSAFCSSKKFALQPLHDLVAITRKRNSKAQDAPRFTNGSDIDTEKNCSGQVKAFERVPSMEKTSELRTLKDHLYQCPSKLSEEMVRCMAAVYFWLRSAAPVNPGKKRSPLLSRSSTNVVLPRHGMGEDQDCCCKSQAEISWISTDKSQFSQASYAIDNYRVLVEQLEKVTVNRMENNARTAFWINVYNSLVMHAYLAYGIPHNSLRRLALFHKAAYNIGGHIINANAIEHSIFCFHTHRVGGWLETIFSTALKKKSGEERQLVRSKLGLTNPEPLVCFALCTGAFSDPVLKVYTASSIQEELDAVKREFLQAHVTVKKSKKVFLPRVLERYAREASLSSDDLFKWVTENVDKKLHDSIQKCIDRKSNKKASQIIEWLPYSSRFRYILSKELTEKPCWA